MNKGINIAEALHPINILPPHDANTVATPEVFSMAEAAHVSILLQLGVTGAAITVTVEACDDFSASNTTAIAFKYYPITTAGSDVRGARTAATSSGFATSTNDSIMYMIEIDTAELTAAGITYPNLRLVLSDPDAATFVSAAAILSGLRYGSAGTQIA